MMLRLTESLKIKQIKKLEIIFQKELKISITLCQQFIPTLLITPSRVLLDWRTKTKYHKLKIPY